MFQILALSLLSLSLSASVAFAKSETSCEDALTGFNDQQKYALRQAKAAGFDYEIFRLASYPEQPVILIREVMPSTQTRVDVARTLVRNFATRARDTSYGFGNFVYFTDFLRELGRSSSENRDDIPIEAPNFLSILATVHHSGTVSFIEGNKTSVLAKIRKLGERTGPYLLGTLATLSMGPEVLGFMSQSSVDIFLATLKAGLAFHYSQVFGNYAFRSQTDQTWFQIVFAYGASERVSKVDEMMANLELTLKRQGSNKDPILVIVSPGYYGLMKIRLADLSQKP